MTDQELRELFQGLETRFETRFAGLEARFDGLEARFDGLEARFNGLEARFDGLAQQFKQLETRFDVRTEEIKLHFDVYREHTDRQTELLAEGVTALNEKVDRNNADIREEMRHGFADHLGYIHFAAKVARQRR